MQIRNPRIEEPTVYKISSTLEKFTVHINKYVKMFMAVLFVRVNSHCQINLANSIKANNGIPTAMKIIH